MDHELEPLYLYILSGLPIRKLEIFEQWRKTAGSFEAIYFASEPDLTQMGFGLELIIKLREIKKNFDVEKLAQSLRSTAVQTLPYFDPSYPQLLKEIFDAPPVIFYRGKMGHPQEACVAIVGSRKMSAYGLAVMPRIAGPLIDSGVTIVSGMAYGIDTAAHSESLKSGTRTIAVLGSGVDDDSVYPRAHLRLAHQILDNSGLIISEQPPGTPGLKQNFIARNRIIAGLSLGVVIVECKTKSGALLTADFAADFNRALYAVPGPIYSALSDGPHKLIQQQGAKLIYRGEDILDDLKISLTQLPITPGKRISEPERIMLECIQEKPSSLNELVNQTKLPIEAVIEIVTALEMDGRIRELGNGLYAIA